MTKEEIHRKLYDYILTFKGVHVDEKENESVFILVSKPFAAIYPGRIEIKAKRDYNETIRILHEEITEGERGDDWNCIRYSESLPYEVISDMAERGYRLTYGKLPKKVQREIDEYYHG